MTPLHALNQYVTDRDRMTAHLAGTIVCGLFYGRFPTAVFLSQFPTPDALIGVEHDASFARLVGDTGARLAGPEEQPLLERTAREDAALALAGRAAEIALGVSSPEKADALSAEDVAAAASALARAFGAGALAEALDEARRAAEDLFEREDARAVLRVIDEDLKVKLWQGFESVDPEAFGVFLDNIIEGTGLFGAGLPDMASE